MTLVPFAFTSAQNTYILLLLQHDTIVHFHIVAIAPHMKSFFELKQTNKKTHTQRSYIGRFLMSFRHKLWNNCDYFRFYILNCGILVGCIDFGFYLNESLSLALCPFSLWLKFFFFSFVFFGWLQFPPFTFCFFFL